VLSWVFINYISSILEIGRSLKPEYLPQVAFFTSIAVVAFIIFRASPDSEEQNENKAISIFVFSNSLSAFSSILNHVITEVFSSEKSSNISSAFYVILTELNIRNQSIIALIVICIFSIFIAYFSAKKIFRSERPNSIAVFFSIFFLMLHSVILLGWSDASIGSRDSVYSYTNYLIIIVFVSAISLHFSQLITNVGSLFSIGGRKLSTAITTILFFIPVALIFFIIEIFVMLTILFEFAPKQSNDFTEFTKINDETFVQFIKGNSKLLVVFFAFAILILFVRKIPLLTKTLKLYFLIFLKNTKAVSVYFIAVFFEFINSVAKHCSYYCYVIIEYFKNKIIKINKEFLTATNKIYKLSTKKPLRFFTIMFGITLSQSSIDINATYNYPYYTSNLPIINPSIKTDLISGIDTYKSNTPIFEDFNYTIKKSEIDCVDRFGWKYGSDTDVSTSIYNCDFHIKESKGDLIIVAIAYASNEKIEMESIENSRSKRRSETMMNWIRKIHQNNNTPPHIYALNLGMKKIRTLGSNSTIQEDYNERSVDIYYIRSDPRYYTLDFSDIHAKAISSLVVRNINTIYFSRCELYKYDFYYNIQRVDQFNCVTQ